MYLAVIIISVCQSLSWTFHLIAHLPFVTGKKAMTSEIMFSRKSDGGEEKSGKRRHSSTSSGVRMWPNWDSNFRDRHGQLSPNHAPESMSQKEGFQEWILMWVTVFFLLWECFNSKWRHDRKKIMRLLVV